MSARYRFLQVRRKAPFLFFEHAHPAVDEHLLLFRQWAAITTLEQHLRHTELTDLSHCQKTSYKQIINNQNGFVRRIPIDKPMVFESFAGVDMNRIAVKQLSQCASQGTMSQWSRHWAVLGNPGGKF